MEISNDTYFKLCNKCKKLVFEEIRKNNKDVSDTLG